MQMLFNAIVGLIAWLAKKYGERVTIGTASITAFVALTAVLATTLHALVVGVAAYFEPPTWLVGAICYVTPAHYALYIGSYISAQAAAQFYRVTLEKMKRFNGSGLL